MEIDKNAAAAAAAVGDLVVFTCANAYSPIDCLLFAFVPSVSFSLSDSLVSFVYYKLQWTTKAII